MESREPRIAVRALGFLSFFFRIFSGNNLTFTRGATFADVHGQMNNIYYSCIASHIESY